MLNDPPTQAPAGVDSTKNTYMCKKYTNIYIYIYSYTYLYFYKYVYMYIYISTYIYISIRFCTLGHLPNLSLNLAPVMPNPESRLFRAPPLVGLAVEQSGDRILHVLASLGSAVLAKSLSPYGGSMSFGFTSNIDRSSHE